MEDARRTAHNAGFKLKAIALADKKGNREAARMFGVNESMVRRWRLQREDLSQCKKTTKAFRGNKSRWPDLENLLESWVNAQRADGRRVSTVQMRLKALTIATENNIQDFKGGPSWCFRFMKRKGLFIKPRTGLDQDLPLDYEDEVTNFQDLTQIKSESFIKAEDIKMEEEPLALELPLIRTVKEESDTESYNEVKTENDMISVTF